ncbi:uncharacterized protein LOC142348134 isoform X2 [Convolutriloba macropyga]|uniref:uncharacterized protein LOC142348134 isoform X2 n=1 Tax=Convolutriloba macropyga TaxID=536237 RepID=UPI003F524F92
MARGASGIKSEDFTTSVGQDDEQEISEGLNKLKHLAHKMRVDAGSFSEKDTMFVQELVAYLQSLHEECVKLREVYETETINASALRYHLYYLPTQIQREIKQSVRQARESNTTRIQSLEDTLSQIESNMGEMKGKLTVLEKENVTLHPQRDKLHERHEEVVTHLNQTMQEKASKQILLNDTRDQLREAHQTIADIEDDMLELEEVLKQERQQTKKHKRELKREIDETKRRIKEQESDNLSKKDELDELRKELEARKERLQIKSRSTGMIEKNCAQLKAREENLEKHLERVRSENDKMRAEIVSITRSDFEKQAEYTEVREKLELQLKEIQDNSQSTIEENEKLTKQNMKLHTELKQSNEEKKGDLEAMRSLKDELSSHQQEMNELTDETGRLNAENEQMSQEIQAIQETHDSAMKVKNSEADALKDKLLDVQNLRKQLQHELDEVLRQMDRVKADNARQLSILNKEITEGKKTHALLTKEGQELQASIKKSETEIKRCQESLKQGKQNYQTLRDKLEKDIHMYEASIDKYTKARDEKAKRLEEDTPIFIKLQEDHKLFTQTYNDRKRMITGLKAQNTKLKDEVFVTTQVLEQLATPKKQAQDSIARCRRETVEELEKQGRDKKRLETVVAEVGEKIVCVVDQNTRLSANCDQMREQVNQLTEDIIDSGHNTRQLHNQCIDKRNGLMSGWEGNLADTLEQNRRDGLVLEEMGEQERVTVERNEKLEIVANQLQSHIAHMSEFLTLVTNYRGGSIEEEPEEKTETSDSDNSKSDHNISFQSENQEQISLLSSRTDLNSQTADQNLEINQTLNETNDLSLHSNEYTSEFPNRTELQLFDKNTVEQDPNLNPTPLVEKDAITLSSIDPVSEIEQENLSQSLIQQQPEQSNLAPEIEQKETQTNNTPINAVEDVNDTINPDVDDPGQFLQDKSEA